MPFVRKVPGFSAPGASQSDGLRDVDTRLGTSTGAGGGAPLPPRGGSGPRSPAITSGPHMIATRPGLSGVGSRWNAFGSTSATLSPAFQVRLSSTYEPATGTSFTGSPFTVTLNPSPAHRGRRSAIVKVFGVAGVTVKVAASPSGNVVSMASLTPASAQLTVDGT